MEYPVMVFAEGQARPRRSGMDLQQCSVKALKSGHYDDMSVVDSSGRDFRLDRVEKVRKVTVAPFNTKGWEVRLHYCVPQSISLDEFKSRLVDVLERSDIYDEERPDTDLKKVVKEGQDHRSIIEAFF